MAEGTVFGCFSIGSVAATYDEIYVPRIFIPWARLLLERADLSPGESLLDVATGPGTVARLAAEQVGPRGRVLGTDISAAMIGIAQKNAIAGEAAAIEYLAAPAAPLPAVDEYRLPLIYEAGIAQGLATCAASPVATTVAELTDDERARLWEAGRRRLEPLVVQGAVSTEMVSHLAVATP